MRPAKYRRVACLSCLVLVCLPVDASQRLPHHDVLRRQEAAQPTSEPLIPFVKALQKATSLHTNPKTLTNKKTRTVAKPKSTAKPTPTAKPSSTLVPVVTTTTAARTVSATGWYPRPTSFVTRDKTKLLLDGQPFRAIGFNAYWLGLDENTNPSPSYPAKSRVREVFAIAVAMGASVIRAHTLGISTSSNGGSLQLQTGPNTFNDKAFEAIDYAIYAAREYGIRLIIPLTDQYKWYHGGLFDFLSWAGECTTCGSYLFYQSSKARSLFKAYIKKLLTHTNQFTNTRLCDDPTIMAWETGNEFGAWMLQSGAPPAEFTNDIANYIRSLAPKHLVMDGSDGVTSASGEQIAGLNVGSIDMVSDHLYPLKVDLANNDLSVSNSHNKNLFWGEFDWDNTLGGDSLASFLSLLEKSTSAGAAAWSVMSHDASCSYWIEHNEGYSLYYQSGSAQDDQLALAQSFHRLTRRGPPRSLNSVTCPQPPLAKGGN